MKKCLYCDENVKNEFWPFCNMSHLSFLKEKSKCVVCGDTNKMHFNLKLNGFLCQKHAYATYYGKNPFERRRGETNSFTIHKDYVVVDIRNVKAIKVSETKISFSDMETVLRYNWCMSGKYIGGIVDNKRTYLHHFLIGKKKGFVVDHINEDKLDNRRENLQFLTNSVNLQKAIAVKKIHFFNAIMILETSNQPG